jgi:hypothetical protein
MNKKHTLVILLIISSALLCRPARRLWLILLLVGGGVGNEVAAQFFQGFGATVGVTKAKQKWFVMMPDSSTEIFKKKNRIGFNGSLRAEFINSEYVRWITEFQFNQKGCKDKTDSIAYKNRLNYICWNNFLKLQFETFEGFPYLLMGPRVEYLLNKKITSPAFLGDFKKFNFSWSVGVGFEKIVYSYFKPFIEIHYNPDTPFYYAYETTPLDVRNRAWELRIGLIFRSGGHDSCPSVVY